MLFHIFLQRATTFLLQDAPLQYFKIRDLPLIFPFPFSTASKDPQVSQLKDELRQLFHPGNEDPPAVFRLHMAIDQAIQTGHQSHDQLTTPLNTQPVSPSITAHPVHKAVPQVDLEATASHKSTALSDSKSTPLSSTHKTRKPFL